MRERSEARPSLLVKLPAQQSANRKARSPPDDEAANGFGAAVPRPEVAVAAEAMRERCDAKTQESGAHQAAF